MSDELKKEETTEEVKVEETTNTESELENVDELVEVTPEEIKVNDPLADLVIDEKNKKVIKPADIKAGMYLKIQQRIFEKNAKGEEKSRLQAYEGLVVARKHGNQPGATFTVRKVTKTGHTIEKIYPLYLPTLEKIELLRTFRAVKSKLYFVRKKNARKLRSA